MSQALPVVTRLFCPPEMPLTMSEPIGISLQACKHLPGVRMQKDCTAHHSLAAPKQPSCIFSMAAMFSEGVWRPMDSSCLPCSFLHVQACSPPGIACIQDAAGAMLRCCGRESKVGDVHQGRAGAGRAER